MSALQTPPEGPDPWVEMARWLEEDEFDTPEEVSAAFTAKRRISLIYGAIFFGLTLCIPLFNIAWRTWLERSVWGGFTLAYLAVHLVYPTFYILLGIAYTVQVNRVEEDLLGRVVPPPSRRGE